MLLKAKMCNELMMQLKEQYLFLSKYVTGRMLMLSDSKFL